MYLSLLFWLALLLPGYVVVRRIWKDDLDSGLLGMIGLSYLAVFGLLSPISILCYLLHAPLWVFSTACFLTMVTGAIEITRQGWWGQIGKLAVGGLGIELLIVAMDMVMGARVGAFIGGDAALHLTRIRFLLDHGFTNYDPFVAGEFFFPIYHTNLQHALYAACSQLTGIPYFEVWFAGLPWAKLLIAAGAYYMAWSIFDRRWVAWTAAVFTVGCQGPVDFLVYPNKLAPLWVVPMMIGFAARACQPSCTWRSPLKLAVGSLILGQVHGLYGAFAGVVLGPTLACVGLLRVLRRKADRWRVLACTAVLAAALPFALVSKSGITSESRVDSAAGAAPTKEPQAAANAAEGRVKMGPRAGWGTVHGWRPLCLGVGIVCALAGSRRKQAAVLLAVAGTAALIFYVPPLCTAALEIVEKQWVLSRMGFVLYLGFVGLVPASVAFHIERKTRFPWVRSIISVLVLLLGMAFASPRDPYTWKSYGTKFVASSEHRLRQVHQARRVVTFCEDNIPRGVTVLADEWSGMVLTMVHDCHIVAGERGSNGVPDMPRRRRDLEAMLAANTPWETRRALLRKYEVEYFFPAGSPVQWVRGHVKRYPTDREFALYVLNTSD